MIKDLLALKYDVKFDENNHIYTINDEKYTSVSSYIKKFINEPDFDKIAVNIMMQTGEDPRVKWNDKKNDAINIGNDIHRFAESVIKCSGIVGIGDSNFNKKISVLNFLRLIKSKGFNIIGSEVIVYDTSIKVAGTIDLLAIDKEDIIYIFDWKTNKIIDKEIGKLVFDNSNATLIDKYALQLSMYKHIILNYVDNEIRLALVHITDSKFNVIKIKPFSKNLLYEDK